MHLVAATLLLAAMLATASGQIRAQEAQAPADTVTCGQR